MCLLSITEQGLSIKKESKRLFVTRDDEEIAEIQALKLDAFLLFGNIQISSQALAMLSENNIPVTFLCLDGNIKGQFLPPAFKNIDLRYDQYRRYSDDSFRFRAVRYILSNKIQSYIDFYKNEQKNNRINECAKVIGQFKEFLLKIESANSLDSLLGYEGSASRLHFSEFGKLFKGEILFTKRSKFPPADEANALLSFGYTMLFKLINGIVYATGFDPYLGFLHQPDYNRASFTCDIQEFFRVNVVDKFVLSLCNLGIIKKEHFTDTEKGPRFTKPGLELFMKNWKKLAYDTSADCLIDRINHVLLQFNKSIRGKSVNQIPKD